MRASIAIRWVPTAIAGSTSASEPGLGRARAPAEPDEEHEQRAAARTASSAWRSRQRDDVGRERVDPGAAPDRRDHAERQREHDRDQHAARSRAAIVYGNTSMHPRVTVGLPFAIGALVAEDPSTTCPRKMTNCSPSAGRGPCTRPSRALLRGRLAAGQVVDRIARHEVQEREHQDRHAEDRQQARAQAPQQERADRHLERLPGVEQDGHRAAVDQLDLHHGAEAPVATSATPAARQRGDELLVERARPPPARARR